MPPASEEAKADGFIGFHFSFSFVCGRELATRPAFTTSVETHCSCRSHRKVFACWTTMVIIDRPLRCYQSGIGQLGPQCVGNLPRGAFEILRDLESPASPEYH